MNNHTVADRLARVRRRIESDVPYSPDWAAAVDELDEPFGLGSVHSSAIAAPAMVLPAIHRDRPGCTSGAPPVHAYPPGDHGRAL